MTANRDLLQQLQASCAPSQTWKPTLLRAGSGEAHEGIASLHADGQIAFFHDSIRDQLTELIETRCPSESLADAELERRAEQYLAGTAWEDYGSWVHYPWSKRLVHVLPRTEYLELRTSRNRNKITREEQERLRELRIGVIGLSVGQASAVTLAMEEVGGSFYLADFDQLSLSNLNRLRSGAHSVGVHKAFLTAREIFEINPYASIEVFEDGITEDNADSFLRPDGSPLDVVVEECDDFYMKIRIRERSRELGIPVVMETSDRGMIDVERFDKEPNRPLFHGLIEGLNAEGFKAMSTLDKLPLGLEIIGGQGVSDRLAASAVELGESIKTWPQLASAVALGGASNTDTIRRMALGTLNESGRYYVDFNQAIADGAGADVQPSTDFRSISPEALAELQVPELELSNRQNLSDDQIRDMVAYGVMAPTGGNAQPWRFVWDQEVLHCILVPERSEILLDYNHLASYLGFGAFTENIDLVADQLGFSMQVEMFPKGPSDNEVCALRFSKIDNHSPKQTALFEQIKHRLTNRKIGARVPIQPEDGDYLTQVVEAGDGCLQLLSTPEQLAAIADFLGPADRLRFMSKQMHKELMDEIRWNAKEVERTRDGLDVATLELSPVDLAGLRLATSMGVMNLVGKVGGGRSLEKPTRKMIAAASAVGMITGSGGHTPQSLFDGGRLMQRAWLAAAAKGYAFQPMTAVICLFWRLLDGAPGLKAKEIETLQRQRQIYLDLFDIPEGTTEIMLFRIARSDPPTAHSLRLRIEDVLEIQDAPTR